MRVGIRTWLPVAAVVALGAGLRFYGLGDESLWVDEGATVWRARMGVAEMAASTARDTHPPLYLGLMHFWIKAAGDGEAGLRSFSAVCGTATILLMYVVAARLFGRRTALLTAALGAASPHFIHWSQEARSYSFLGALGLASMYYYLKLYERTRMRDRAAVVLLNALLLYTHNYALFFILAQNVHYGLKWLGNRDRPRPPAGAFAGMQLITAGLYAPWVPTLIIQTMQVHEGYWIQTPTLSTLTETIAAFSGSAPLALLLAALAAAGLVAVRREGRLAPGRNFLSELGRRKWELTLPDLDANFFLGTWFAVSLLCPFVSSLLTTPVFHQRLAYLSSLPLYLLAGRGLGRRGWRLGGLALAAALLLDGWALVPYYSEPQREQWREAVGWVEARARSGDVALVYPSYAYNQTYKYYARRTGLAAAALPAKRGRGPEPGELARLLLGRNSAWLIMRRTGGLPPPREEEVGRIGWRVAERKIFLRVEVWRLQRWVFAPGPGGK